MKRISYRHKAKSLSIFDVVGIVSTALLIFVSAFYILAPAISSYARGGDTKVTLNVSPVVSISVDAENIDFDITPTPEGVFKSKQVTASVLTNSSGGYELYFSSVDNQTDLISQTVSTVIPSDFNNTVTSLSMPANNWGYSMNGTDFSKIPALNAQATLKNIDHYPTDAEKTTTVNIGMKIDTNIPSGTYSKSVVFSAVAHETLAPTTPTMQSFACSELSNVGDSTVLTDTRDGNRYTVKKLADGNCWMAENLRLIDKTISSTDSNLPSGETYTVPASNASSFTPSSYNTNSAYLDSTYGAYYNFYTATAGTGGTSLTSGNAPSSICPKGWRLPTGGDSGEFKTLYRIYNLSALMQGEPSFTLSGIVDVYSGSVEEQGSSGSFWSSTALNGTNSSAYNLVLGSSSVYPARNSKRFYGFSVRCVAEGTISYTMQTFDASTMIPNTGDAMMLRDERDDILYVVKRLADGNVWMTENLRLIDKTISSADSNLPSGETYTVPASDASSFTESHNTSAAFLGYTYGGYYNFYTATAGWGTDSVTSGNSPKDICPKGWRLPTGGDSGEFQTLYNNYNSGALMMGVPNFTLSGTVYGGYESDQTDYGNFWSSTVFGANIAYKLGLNYSNVRPADFSRVYNGFAVRCVAQ